jgi:hypothetical protein
MGIEISREEKLLWKGKPAPGLHFSPQDLFIVPFSVLWLGGVSAGALSVPYQAHIDPMLYVMLPVFVLIGLYVTVGRFVVDIYARRRTDYVLTDQRAIISSGLLRPSTRSVNLVAVAEIRFRPGRHGRGTVEFGSPGMFAMMPRNWPGMGQFLPAAFDGIEDALRIYDLALTAQREGQRGR